MRPRNATTAATRPLTVDVSSCDKARALHLLYMGDEKLRTLQLPPDFYDLGPAQPPPWQWDAGDASPLGPLAVGPSQSATNNPYLQPLPPLGGPAPGDSEPRSLLDDWGALQLGPWATGLGPLTINPFIEPGDDRSGPWQAGLPAPDFNPDHAGEPDANDPAPNWWDPSRPSSGDLGLPYRQLPPPGPRIGNGDDQ